MAALGHTRPKLSKGPSGRYWVVSGLGTWVPSVRIGPLGKDASRGSRGHSLRYCAVDTELTVRHNADSGIATATIAKQRDGTAGQQIAFALAPVGLGHDADGDPVTSCVLEEVLTQWRAIADDALRCLRRDA
jgi:hypothetical protein